MLRNLFDGPFVIIGAVRFPFNRKVANECFPSGAICFLSLDFYFAAFKFNNKLPARNLVHALELSGPNFQGIILNRFLPAGLLSTHQKD